MLNLGTLCLAILTDLRAVITRHAPRDRAQQVLLTLTWHRLARLAQRFRRLYDHWQ
eukprot:gene57237-78434_t